MSTQTLVATPPVPTTVSTPVLAPHSRVRLLAVSPALWRVVDADGRALGHLQQVTEARGQRFRARRFHVASRRFRDIGDFWTAQDAVDALRYSR